jgi:murein DD-endopeptidase MepM/ murein hydrolase activator NlpD
MGAFKINEGILIAAEENADVMSCCKGVVSKIYSDDEHGNMLELAIGNDYTVTYGQLADINVNIGDEVDDGQVIATVSAPTAYFLDEGAHIYMEVRENGESVDPLLLLK